MKVRRNDEEQGITADGRFSAAQFHRMVKIRVDKKRLKLGTNDAFKPA
jgi:hypothetical protein